MWPLVGHGHRSLAVGVGRWLWPLVVGRGRWPLVVGGHRCQSSSLSVIVVTAIVTLQSPVVSAAPSMAEGTASVEPAGGAEKARTARPEAWDMVRQGRMGHFEVARRQDTKGWWVSASAGHSQRLHAMAAVQMDRAGHCEAKRGSVGGGGQDNMCSLSTRNKTRVWMDDATPGCA